MISSVDWSGIDIATEDIADILSRLSKRIYICQEVIWGDGEAVQPSEYVRNGVSDLFLLSRDVDGYWLSR